MKDTTPFNKDLLTVLMTFKLDGSDLCPQGGPVLATYLRVEPRDMFGHEGEPQCSLEGQQKT